LDESAKDSEIVSKPLNGDFTVTTTDTTSIAFTPYESFQFNTHYLILIRGLLDTNYEPILPYIGMFETENNINDPETPETIAPTPQASEEPETEFNANDLIINEVLADPPDGIAGDANQDGIRDSYDDEFIEIINTTSEPLPLNGVSIRVGTSTKYTFSTSAIIPENGCIVVFGGGNPPSKIGNADVFVSTSSLKLTNSGATITLEKNNVAISSVTYDDTASTNQSLTRYPDITGDFIPHSEIFENDSVLLFSPGAKTDGSAF
jgi:hypothetical protein